MHSSVLHVDLTVNYPGKPGLLRGLQLDVQPGEIVGLAGESGSGKSTLALAIMRLLDPRRARLEGQILWQGTDLLRCTEREMRRIRGKGIGLVLQGASSSFNPMLSIGAHLREAWRAHSDENWAQHGKAHAASLLQSVELPADDAFLERYPAQISIGQAQRVLIAMAVMHKPSLVIADEPTSALDLLTQAQVLKLVQSLSRSSGVSWLFISHDLPVVAAVCDRICILYGGQIVESGTCATVFERPKHPYTQAILGALPQPNVASRIL